MRRDAAEVTRVEKQGEGYEIHGVADGLRKSFRIDAQTFEGLRDKQGFMRRTIRGLVDAEKGERG